MPLLRFAQAKPFFALGILLAAWLVLPIAVKSVLRTGLLELQAPVEISASYARDLQDFWSLRVHSKNELIEAGRDLARLNAAYEVRLQENQHLRGENQRLEALLNLPPVAAYRSEPARVARRDLSSWWQRIIIRKGRNYGITVDAPVIFVGGVVGRVVEVGAFTAVVELISSPGVRVAASLAGDHRPFSFQGGYNRPFHSLQGSVEFVPLDVFASDTRPVQVVTSGIGGVFPPGLIIGSISRLEPSADGLFKSGTVHLDPRLNALTEVTVLVPLEPGS